MTKPSFARAQRFAPSNGPLINLTQTVDGLYLQIAGDLDMAAVPRLDGLVRALERAPRSVYLDLAGVRFADSSGLAPFLESAQRRLRDHRPPLTVAALSRAVQRVMDLLAEDRGVMALVGRNRT
jgi:anti-anti-sigma factor